MKIARLALLTGALASCAPELVRAQSLPILTRATAPEITDSALYLITIASPFRTRAVTGALLKTYFVPAVVDSATGAARAQKLTTARTIGGVSFDGTANIIPDSATGSARAQTLTTSRTFWGLTFNGSANVSGKPAFASAWSSTGRDSLLAGSALAFAVNDTVYGQPVWNATQTFATGQLVDSATGSARSQTLTTSRTIWGQAFNGSANVTAAPTFGAGATVSNGQTLALGTSTITGTPTWSSVQAFAATQRVDSATGAARASALVGSPAITVSSCTGCGGGTPQDSIRLKNGAAATPSLMFANSLTTGLYRFGADTIGVTTGGVASLGIRGGASPTIFGGAGDLTIAAGTGNSRKLVLQTTTSGGTATTAVRFNQVQQSVFPAGTFPTPTLAFSNDTTTGFYSSAAANWRFILSGGIHTQFTAAGITLSSNGSNTGSFIAGGAGTATNTPDFTFGNSPTTGMYRFGADTIGFATSGAASLGLRGGSTPTIFGGAGNLTIQAGTGASRTLTLQTTTSGSAVKNVLVLGADSSTTTLGSLTVGATRINAPSGTAGTPSYTFTGNNGDGFSLSASLDTVKVSSNATVQMLIGQSGALKLPLLPAEGSTKNAMCWDGTTFQVTQNAAATCTVSSARFKENIVPLDAATAWGIVGKTELHSSTYNERSGGRLAIGIVAEQADSADSRLASRDGTGLITSTNYEEITSLLLPIVKELRATVKDQQRVIDSMRTAARRRKP